MKFDTKMGVYHIMKGQFPFVAGFVNKLHRKVLFRYQNIDGSPLRLIILARNI